MLEHVNRFSVGLAQKGRLEWLERPWLVRCAGCVQQTGLSALGRPPWRSASLAPAAARKAPHLGVGMRVGPRPKNDQSMRC